jgi:hypothetical protein
MDICLWLGYLFSFFCSVLLHNYASAVTGKGRSIHLPFDIKNGVYYPVSRYTLDIHRSKREDL